LLQSTGPAAPPLRRPPPRAAGRRAAAVVQDKDETPPKPALSRHRCPVNPCCPVAVKPEPIHWPATCSNSESKKEREQQQPPWQVAAGRGRRGLTERELSTQQQLHHSYVRRPDCKGALRIDAVCPLCAHSLLSVSHGKRRRRHRKKTLAKQTVVREGESSCRSRSAG
jgi:hypothetical protein